MKVAKKIFVGSIILILLMTTPVIARAGVNETTKKSSLSVSGENSLGTAILRHQPLLRTIFNDKGLITEYEPPAANPHFEYYFPEDESGYVHLNFTLTVKHLKNPIPTYWAPHRWSGITVWINVDGQDYCYNRTLTECHNSTFEEYNISIIGTTPLFTNNSTTHGTFYCIAFPVPSFTMNPTEKWIDICQNNFSDKVAVEDITIIPT